jgi:hypothetical protein
MAKNTATPLKAEKTELTLLANTVAANKAEQDIGLTSAIAEWSSTRSYGKDNICIRNKAFYISNANSNLNKDPLTDTSAAWGPFVPGETNSLFFNRAPINTDVYPAGVKWYDTSFGSDTPLVSISLGNGNWGYLNQITLTKIRIFVSGRNTSYRSTLSGIRCLKSDGTQLPYTWFVWGNKTISGGNVGAAYTGGAINTSYAAGWFDLEVSSTFDTSVSINKVTADFPLDGTYTSVSSVEFWYSNGAKKSYSGPNWSMGGGLTLCTINPALPGRYGDATSAAQGEMLTSSKLADANDVTYGRVSGATYNSAFAIAFANMIKTYEDRIAALEAKLP